MTKLRAATSYTLPAPTTGWNARDPLDLMAETDAIRMINVFPDTASCKIRGGYFLHNDIANSTEAVKTLYEHTQANGTKQLISVSNNKFWNVTSGSATNITGALTVSDSYYQTTSFRNSSSNYGVFVNGSNAPKLWEGTTLTDMALTGFTQANAIHVSVFKRRLYFVEKNTTRVWYPAVDAIAGACSSFDVGTLLNRGGYLMWSSSWSGDYGQGLATVFVMCSSEGEILVYAGNDPSDWALVGHYFIGRPLGRRSFLKYQAELLILTEEGVVPLSKALSLTQDQEVPKITDKIQKAFIESAKNYASNVGWEMFHYPAGNQILINIPVSNTRVDQYVTNTLTGAWCEFRGIPAFTWGLLGQSPYFGSIADDQVHEFDSGNSDNGDYIRVSVKQAFTYFQDRAARKRFCLARPVFSTNDSISFHFDVDVDFQDKYIETTIQTESESGVYFDLADWDDSEWSDNNGITSLNWYGIRGMGFCAALRMQGDFLNTYFEHHATNITFERGGVI